MLNMSTHIYLIIYYLYHLFFPGGGWCVNNGIPHYSMYKYNDDTVWYILILSGGYSVIAIIWQRGNTEVSQLAIAL